MTVRTFRASPSSFAALCGVTSVPAVICGLGLLTRPDLGAPFAFAVTIPAASALLLAYYRLRIDDSGIEYRGLVGTAFRVAYSDIATLKTRTIWVDRYPRSSYELSTLYLRDGRKLRMNLAPFPKEASRILSERLHSDA